MTSIMSVFLSYSLAPLLRKSALKRKHADPLWCHRGNMYLEHFAHLLNLFVGGFFFHNVWPTNLWPPFCCVPPIMWKVQNAHKLECLDSRLRIQLYIELWLRGPKPQGDGVGGLYHATSLRCSAGSDQDHNDCWGSHTVESVGFQLALSL